LRKIIAELNAKNQGNTQKEEIIYALKNTIKKMNDEQIRTEQEKTDLKEKVKYWKSRSEAFEQDKNFLQDQVLEGKRKNKLLKLAISRLQNEMEKKDQVLRSTEPGAVKVVQPLKQTVFIDNNNTFVTSGLQQTVDPQ
jgi:SMC interacting uncharacterized protein involved in chromosome segregation